MSITSKSPRKVWAWQIGKFVLQDYTHRFSPKTYSRPQLFACLVLGCFMKRDYRGLEAYLIDAPNLCRDIGLTRVPDHTTFCRAQRSLLRQLPGMMFLQISACAALGRRRNIHLAAVDSSGFDTTRASRYYVQRRAHYSQAKQHVTYRRFGKLTALVDTRSHVIVGALIQRGPSPDVDQLAPVLERRVRSLTFHHVLGDAGYDSESNHQLLREEHGIRSTMPARHGRPSDKPPKGKYRSLMRRRFNVKAYRQRSQIETVWSMIKGNLGSTLSSYGYWSQCRSCSMCFPGFL